MVSLNKAISLIKKSILFNEQNPNTKKLEYCLLGRPGIGKSSGVIQMAKELGKSISIISLSTRNKEDLTGVPMLNWDDMLSHFLYRDKKEQLTTKIKYSRPEFLDSDIIFIDEITNAELYEFTPIAQLISERRIGDHILKPTTTIIAAGNKPEHSILAKDLPSIIVSRFVILDIDVDINELIQYGIEKNWESEILSFIENRKELLTEYKMDTLNQNFICPRTIEKADTVVKMYMQKQIDKEELEQLLIGTLGPNGKDLVLHIENVKDKMPYKRLCEILKSETLFNKEKKEYNEKGKKNKAILIATAMDINYFLRQEKYDEKVLHRAMSFIEDNVVSSLLSNVLISKGFNNQSTVSLIVNNMLNANVNPKTILNIFKDSKLYEHEKEIEKLIA